MPKKGQIPFILPYLLKNISKNKIVFSDSVCYKLPRYISFMRFLGRPKFEVIYVQCLCIFENKTKSYFSVPNFNSIAFEIAELWGGGGESALVAHVCTPHGIGLRQYRVCINFYHLLIYFLHSKLPSK